MTDDPVVEFRRGVLKQAHAPDGLVDELLPYTDTPYRPKPCTPGPTFPLPDEPHVERWTDYLHDSSQRGVFEALSRRFVQLRFPIRDGISQEEAYGRATRRGQFEAAEPYLPGLVLQQPGLLELQIVPTPAGRIPVLIAGVREDFVMLVQAFCHRNEPHRVPASMGACTVVGLNNWDRIALYRRAWEQQTSQPVSEQAWQEEFRCLVPRKALYQDRFAVLSRGPYSATAASHTGLSELEWLDRSLTIRREHEAVHYFTRRVFGSIRTNILDELIADFVGVVRAFGEYRADLARRFLGLEMFPTYRPGGRLENYRADPPLSDSAMPVIRYLAFQAIENLEIFSRTHRPLLGTGPGLAHIMIALLGLSLEELASRNLSSVVRPGSSDGESAMEGMAE